MPSSRIEFLFSEIEQRHSFHLPASFKELWRRGVCSGEGYLIMPDMEWMPLENILDFQFEAYQMPGLVPFASTASGDLWCWQPEPESDTEPRIVECPHDCEEGNVYARDFASALFRHLLDASAIHTLSEADLTAELARIRHCLSTLRAFLSPEHVDHLETRLDTPLQSVVLPAIRPTRWHFIVTSQEHARVIANEFPEASFCWMQSPSS